MVGKERRERVSVGLLDGETRVFWLVRSSPANPGGAGCGTQDAPTQSRPVPQGPHTDTVTEQRVHPEVTSSHSERQRGKDG